MTKNAGILLNVGLAVCLVGMVATSCETATDKRWKLFYEENFDSGELDATVWKRTTRNKADWGNTQSSDPRCLTFRDGCLVLRGIVNDDLKADTAHFLTGGVVTQGLKALPSPGRYLVRARLHKAQGAWPAIWLLPFEGRWPDGGEIDIMERLNGDSIAYQTVHSHYTHVLKRNDPPHGSTGPIDPDDFNVYGVDILPDSVVMHINGMTTFSYPRIPEEEKNGQYPFITPQYMLIDMQLGGEWVGGVKAEDLPVEMEIDWVRVYSYKI
ncbi:MAG: glycoside hydrolase family 16 protein [Bacteroidales bacterium]|nr:glycoside hydrolase family 16 protein [Bacteroidales bacterium]